MFRGLYGDLPKAKDEDDKVEKKSTVGWSGTQLKPPPSLAVRRREVAESNTLPPSVIARGPSKPLSPVSPKKAAIGETEDVVDDIPSLPTTTAFSIASGIENEYDPAHPNSYDAIVNGRKTARLLAETEAAKQELLRQQKQAKIVAEERAILEMLDAAGNITDTGITDVDEEQRTNVLGVSGEEAWKRRAVVCSGMPGQVCVEEQPVKGMDLAEKLLKKMGWKEGEGLGRNKQGIATPLEVKKTAAAAGVVVLAPLPAPPPEAGQPTRIVALKNIALPSDFSDELDEKIGEKCSEFGTVVDLVFFVVTEPGFPAEDALQAFVKFETEAAAVRLVLHFVNNLFGGRRVTARFFSEYKYDKAELAPLRS